MQWRTPVPTQNPSITFFFKRKKERKIERREKKRKGSTNTSNGLRRRLRKELKQGLFYQHELLHQIETEVKKGQAKLWLNDNIQKSKCLKQEKEKPTLFNTSTGCGKARKSYFKP